MDIHTLHAVFGVLMTTHAGKVWGWQQAEQDPREIPWLEPFAPTWPELEWLALGPWLLLRDSHRLRILSGTWLANGNPEDTDLVDLSVERPPLQSAQTRTLARWADRALLLVHHEAMGETDLLEIAVEPDPKSTWVPRPSSPRPLRSLQGSDWAIWPFASSHSDHLLLVSPSRGEALLLQRDGDAPLFTPLTAPTDAGLGAAAIYGESVFFLRNDETLAFASAKARTPHLDGVSAAALVPARAPASARGVLWAYSGIGVQQVYDTFTLGFSVNRKESDLKPIFSAPGVWVSLNGMMEFVWLHNGQRLERCSATTLALSRDATKKAFQSCPNKGSSSSPLDLPRDATVRVVMAGSLAWLHVENNGRHQIFAVHFCSILNPIAETGL